MRHYVPTQEAATGKWKGILLQLGLDRKFLTGDHGPCPLCGGKDRFRFTNLEGRGTYYCNQCGAGNGMQLAEKFTGKKFAEVASQIDEILGNVAIDVDQVRSPMTDDERKIKLRATYSASVPITPGDLVDKYLRSRHLDELVYPKSLRFAEALPDGEGGIRPCMVAMVTGPDGKPVTMHRTFLRPDGTAKAEMAAPRKLMPGSVPKGVCVRLSEYTGGPLGIAEGIETAMSASNLFTMPVWSAINSALLADWIPPEGCAEVTVFGDNDPKYGGQAAAYRLAHRLSTMKIAGECMSVQVHIPGDVGSDWADVYSLSRGG